MKFATFMLNENASGRPTREILEDTIAEAVLAEELGYDAIWLAEHHFSDYGLVPSTSVMGAAIAARTSRIRIGTGVLVLPFQNPIRIAEDFALLDQLSGGRLDFGVGRGYQPHEFEGFGIPMGESRDRFDEVLEIIEGLWANETFSYQGKYYRCTDVRLTPRPLQQPAPPIWVAAVSRDSFENVARMGKSFMSAPSITPLGNLKKSFDLYTTTLKKEGFSSAGRDYPFQRYVYIGENEEDAYQTPKDHFMWLMRRNQQLIATKGNTDPSYAFYRQAQGNKAQLDYDNFFTNETTIFCTADTAVERLSQIRQELGLTYLLCSFRFGGLPREKADASMRRFAEHVIPAFR